MERAIELEPTLSQAWLDIASPLAHLGRFQEALAAFQHAAELQPELITAFGSGVYAQLGAAFAAHGRNEEAVACLEQSMELRNAAGDGDESLVGAYNVLGLGSQHNGRLPEALAWFDKAMTLQPGSPVAHSNYFWCLQYGDEHSPEFARDKAIEWARKFAPTSLARNPQARSAEGRRLKIGYLSPEFRDHPVAYCIESLLESHDRSRFEIFLYANTVEPDEVSERLERVADHWRNIAELPDDAAADLIQADELDVLVDLTGHTENNRVGVFARKPAPVQAEWLGYYATTGLPQIDYFICNPALIPPEEEGLYVEKPMRLAGKAFSFKPPSENIEVPPLPALLNGAITFGCHNYLAKVTPQVVRVWSAVLHAVPRSRFVMNRLAFMHPNVRAYFAQLFEAQGIDRSRISFQCTSTRAEYLESLGELDVLLDTFPFNGATSIYEALWMGLPVVTMSAPRMVGHFGESILVPLGHPEWVGRSPEDYVAKACALVSDLETLAGLRRGLRDRFVNSPLCDAAAFTREMEDAFVRMHEEKLALAAAGV
jgi:protein O-GlcNAc transferase